MRSYWHILRQYLAPQKATVAVMAVSLLASTGLRLVGPTLVSGFLDAARAGAAEKALVQRALAYVGIMALARVLHVLAGYPTARVAWTATNALRADLTAHLLSLSPAFFKSHRPGEPIERVDGDVNALAEFFSSFWVHLTVSSALDVDTEQLLWRRILSTGVACVAVSHRPAVLRQAHIIVLEGGRIVGSGRLEGASPAQGPRRCPAAEGHPGCGSGCPPRSFRKCLLRFRFKPAVCRGHCPVRRRWRVRSASVSEP